MNNYFKRIKFFLKNKIKILIFLLVFMMAFISVGYANLNNSNITYGSVSLKSGDLLITKLDTSNSSDLSHEYSRNIDENNNILLNGMISYKSNIDSIEYDYKISNLSNETYTYLGYVSNLSNNKLPVPIVDGIKPGDIIKSGENKNIKVTYYDNVIDDSIINSTDTFKFSKGEVFVDFKGIELTTASNSLTTDATGFTYIKINMKNNYDSSIRYVINTSNSSLKTVDSNKVEKTFKYTLNKGEEITKNIYLMSSKNGTYNFKAITTDNDEYISNDFNINSFDFGYTGAEQSWVVPSTGVYKLETWGAEGGSATYSKENVTYNGGKGGYAVGTINLLKNDNLYINVGGKGIDSCKNNNWCEGGYNGGGDTWGGGSPDLSSDLYSQELYAWISSSGGGATSIATQSGILETLENKKDSILIVAGGGGGGFVHRYNNSSNSWRGTGGSGGGSVGIVGIGYGRSNNPTGGSQSAGGLGYDDSTYIGSASFGRGMSVSKVFPTIEDITKNGTFSGGGGGYYGGGASIFCATAGGSSYVSALTDGKTISGDEVMPSYEDTNTITGNSGNGYARITFINS